MVDSEVYTALFQSVLWMSLMFFVTSQFFFMLPFDYRSWLVKILPKLS